MKGRAASLYARAVRIAWCTDIHLDHLRAAGRARFAESLLATGADAVLVTGDISTADRLSGHLVELERAVGRPVLFVLGNHDFYGGSIASVREAMRELAAREPHLRHLPVCEPIALGSRTVLVGCDGFGDARLGHGLTTPVVLNDHLLIRELAGLSRPELVETLRALGDQEATRLREKLTLVRDAEHVIVATHVPPFREATWHEGRASDDQWLPFFSCKAVGDVLEAHARAHPRTSLTVLCGHTHGSGVARLADNLVVYTGGADYGSPVVAGVLEADGDVLTAG